MLPTMSQTDDGAQHASCLVIQVYILVRIAVPDNVRTFRHCQTLRLRVKVPLR